ncbi:MAG: PhzF family phenazine biosynthesis protein [Cyclobacteriaceae bacterium]
MRSIKVNIIHAFEDNLKGGNPAGVVLEADELDNNQKLAIAAKVGLSETAFVSRSLVSDFKLDFFTPSKQIPHCGHATVATFSYLKKRGRIAKNTSSKETIDGTRQIFFDEDLVFMEQRAPEFIPLEQSDKEESLQGLKITSAYLIKGLEPMIVNTGNNFLIVPVQNEKILQNLKPDLSVIERVSEKYNLIAFYVYAPAQSHEAVATTRMFGPYYGIPEEAATGMAAGPLACYLHQYCNMTQDELVITQGRFMHPPSPSRILVRLEKEDNKIKKLFAGGRAYVEREFNLEID